MTAPDLLQRVHDTRGTILVAIDGGPARRWTVAAIRDGLVTFSRVDHRGARETRTLRLQLGRVAA